MSTQDSKQPDAWHADNVTGIAINPFYAITIDKDLFGEHEPLISKEQWIKANARLIEELGAEAYLDRLLKVLSGDFPRQPE